MVQKSAVTKQQDTSQPRADLTAVVEAFHAAVAQSVQDADAEAVHRLRTGSRRLQAMVGAVLREHPGPALQHPAKAWLRLLKQVRRAAGAVRDLDVHRKLLEHWVGKDSPTAEVGDGSSPLSKQAEQLDTWLKGERKQRAQGMQRLIRKRQQALVERQAAFAAARSSAQLASARMGSVRTPRSADIVALEDFVRAADAMPTLDEENLHDFRKATKKARYVAESGVMGENYSSVAKAMKRIQDAIGDWHDWLCLQEEAKAVLGEDAPELSAFLEHEVERHFATAMKTTQTMRGRLLGEWMASQGKRPVAAAAITGRRLASSL
jgi:CHAD domain-containing protein